MINNGYIVMCGLKVDVSGSNHTHMVPVIATPRHIEEMITSLS
jgi:hypothetical protein